MERTLRNHWTGRHAPGFATATLCALTLVACGEEERFSNNPRPAPPLNVSAYISPSAVSVSPQRFGAGLVVVTVTNQSAESHDVTLEGGDTGELAQSTGPINPGDTGQLKVRVQRGHLQPAHRGRRRRPGTGHGDRAAALCSGRSPPALAGRPP